MIRVGRIGVGKMGSSHQAILGAHPRVEVKSVRDRAGCLTAAIRKHARVATFSGLEAAQSKRLAEAAKARGRANQVGHHDRFLGTFQEARRLVRGGALGEVYHVGGSAFGQVAIRSER